MVNQDFHYWDLGLRRGLFDREMESWLGLIWVLDVVRLGEGEDKVYWRLGKGGAFSSKSALLKLSDAPLSLKSSLIAAIWNFEIPKKVKVFLWSLVYRSLNTQDYLQKKCKNWTIPPSVCSMCNRDGESLDHLFIHCPFVAKVGISCWIFLASPFALLDISTGGYLRLFRVVSYRGKLNPSVV